MISPKTYFLNADRTKVVPEGDKTAQFLLVRKGHEIHDALAKTWGLSAGEQTSAEPEEESDKEFDKKSKAKH